LKLAVEAEVVVVDTTVVDELEVPVVDGLVVGAELDEVEGDELHAASRTAAVPAAANPTRLERTFGCNLIGPLDRIEGRQADRSVLRANHLCRPSSARLGGAYALRMTGNSAARYSSLTVPPSWYASNRARDSQS
jgi:hypothetical protein